MSDTVHPVSYEGLRIAPSPGGGWRGLHVVRDLGLLLGGALLFAAARKLVWGTEESLAGAALWATAILPIFVGLILTGVSTSPHAASSRLGRILSSAWTISLLAFVLLRGSGLASVFEDAIYSASEPGAIRYLILSAIYAGVGAGIFALICLAYRSASRRSWVDGLASFFVVFLLFYLAVFVVAF
ncbi:hypothetical protein [Bradyrhizobium diazoefficiens]|uniref:Uncharacterized protein n=1 Tax=Bradyrhizobium diazoefficiens TaxID=1355477 RepID=A0A809WRT0_9BRAD|nr:hypothetical protein XF1B_05010 [Bradyrhizobium diazoefficiens]BCF22548.1 hypothetical protein XF14B_05000 [Bradyrhizobium diazoefficiens]